MSHVWDLCGQHLRCAVVTMFTYFASKTSTLSSFITMFSNKTVSHNLSEMLLLMQNSQPFKFITFEVQKRRNIIRWKTSVRQSDCKASPASVMAWL